MNPARHIRPPTQTSVENEGRADHGEAAWKANGCLPWDRGEAGRKVTSSPPFQPARSPLGLAAGEIPFAGPHRGPGLPVTAWDDAGRSVAASPSPASTHLRAEYPLPPQFSLPPPPPEYRQPGQPLSTEQQGYQEQGKSSPRSPHPPSHSATPVSGTSFQPSFAGGDTYGGVLFQTLDKEKYANNVSRMSKAYLCFVILLTCGIVLQFFYDSPALNARIAATIGGVNLQVEVERAVRLKPRYPDPDPESPDPPDLPTPFLAHHTALRTMLRERILPFGVARALPGMHHEHGDGSTRLKCTTRVCSHSLTCSTLLLSLTNQEKMYVLNRAQDGRGMLRVVAKLQTSTGVHTVPTSLIALAEKFIAITLDRAPVAATGTTGQDSSLDTNEARGKTTYKELEAAGTLVSRAAEQYVLAQVDNTEYKTIAGVIKVLNFLNLIVVVIVGVMLIIAHRTQVRANAEQGNREGNVFGQLRDQKEVSKITALRTLLSHMFAPAAWTKS